MTIGKLVLGASLILVVSIAAAAQIPQSKGAIARSAPVDCVESAVRVGDKAAAEQPQVLSTRDLDDQTTGVHDSSLDEYLSFHAQAVEDSTLSSLMPWSGLRVHVN